MLSIVALLALSFSAMEQVDDPYVWLEDVAGPKPLDWVRQHNTLTHKELEEQPGFAKLSGELLAILDSDAKIPYVSKAGPFYYNLWKDGKHPRGLWRRTTLAEYK